MIHLPQFVLACLCVISVASAEYTKAEGCIDAPFKFRGQDSYAVCTTAFNGDIPSIIPVTEPHCSPEAEITEGHLLIPCVDDSAGAQGNGDDLPPAGPLTCTGTTFTPAANMEPAVPGTTQNSQNTAAACQAVCLTDQNCVGYTFTATGTVCKTYTNQYAIFGFGDTRHSLLNLGLAATGTTFYYRDLCTCVAQATITVNFARAGGIPEAGSFSLASCIVSCLEAAACSAVDFNPVENPDDGDPSTGNCWHHATAGTPGQSPGTTHAIVGSCSTVTCTDSFTGPSLDMYTPGGASMALTDPTSRVECENKCKANAACFGYDWERAVVTTQNSRCWHQLALDFVGTARTGVDQYRRACSPVNQVATGFKNFPDTKMDGGTAQPNLNFAACQDNCRTNTACVGFDWDPNGSPNCWHLLEPPQKDLTLSIDGPGITHYQKVNTCPSFTEHLNMKLAGGTEKTNLATLAACHFDCYQTAACHGFDWTVTTKKCWHHLQATVDYATATAETGTNQYRKTVCPVCTNTFTTIPNRRRTVTDGTNQATAVTQAACNTICMNDPACRGYDFKTATGGVQCVTFAIELLDTNTVAATGYNQYRRDCNAGCVDMFTLRSNTGTAGATQDTTSGITTATQCTEKCRSQATCTGVDFNTATGAVNPCWLHTAALDNPNIGGTVGTDQYLRVDCNTCPDTFTHHVATSAQGGTQDTTSGITTADACKTKCLSQQTCTGVDFNTASGAVNPCWLHTGSLANPNIGGTPGVDQYVRGPCTSTCTEDTFTPTANRASTGATATQGADSEALCKAKCLESAACLGFDLDTSANPQCWLILTQAILDSSATRQGPTQYLRVPCTAATPEPPTCVDTFTMEANFGSGGAAPNTVAKTSAACQQVCLADSTCLGFDFTKNSPTPTTSTLCWIHTNPTTFAAKSADTGADQYTRVTCTGCEDFLHVPLTGTAGAAPNNAATLDACKTVCRADTACLGFDWTLAGTVGSQCWLQTNANFITSAATSTESDQYRKQDCTTPTPTPAGCTDTFTRVQTMSSSGGNGQSGATDIPACQALCLADSTCGAFDWTLTTTASPRCWLHVKPFDATAATADATADQYRRDDCTAACTPSFAKVDNKASAGGTLISGITTPEACQAECRANTACVGLDFDRVSTDKCWLALDATLFATKTDNNNVDQYTLVPCAESTPTPQTCVDTFLKVDNIGTPGAAPNAANTQAACDAACLADTTCLGYDFTTSGTGTLCWIHTNADFITNAAASTSSDQYRRQPCVVGGSPSPAVCTPTYTMVANTGSNGAAPQAAATTLAACQEVCNAAPTCLGLDWEEASTGAKCWTHTDATQFAATATRSGVNQYTKVPCAEGTPTPSACVDSFTVTNDRSSQNGVGQNNVATAAACMDVCRASTTCVGFDWTVAAGGQQCWLHSTVAALDAGTTTSGVNQYKRVDCNIGATSPAPVCLDAFTSVDNLSSQGGTGVNGVTTVEACQTACRDNAVHCVGFDWVVATGSTQCWLHTNPTAFAAGSATTGVNQYTRQDGCDNVTPTSDTCIDTFTEVPTTRTTGASPQTTASTQAACQAACLSETNYCYGFDWTISGSGTLCWLHFASDFAANAESNYAAANQYRRVKCTVDASPTPDGCVIAFTAVPNKSAQGGDLQNGVTTLEACTNACRAQTTCVGFDWTKATVTDRCWFFTDLAVMSANTDNTGVDQYLRGANCDECTPSFTSVENRGSNEGTGDSVPRTVDACMAVCLANTACVGFDFTLDTTQTTVCWIHTVQSAFDSNAVRTGVTQYTKVLCPDGSASPSAVCVDPFTHRAGYSAQGGAGSDGITTVATCQDKCRESSDCVGFDWTLSTTASPRCWLFSDLTAFNANAVSTAVDQYVRDTNACKDCVPSFTLRASKSAQGGSGRNGITAVDDCKDECRDTDNCVGFDWTKVAVANTAQCWLFFDVTLFNANSDDTAVDQYVLVECDDCVDTFGMTANRGGDGASPETGVTDLEICKTRCLDNTACLGFDFSQVTTDVTRCWLHVTAATWTASTTRTNSDQYDRVPCVDTSASPAPCTVDPFTVTNGVKSEGGVNQNGVVELEACKTACRASTECVGFDWTLAASATQKCWLFSQASQMATNTADAGVDQYVRGTCGDCTDTFTQDANKNAQGGTVNPATTLAACQAACLADTACLALDWVKSGTADLCWLHTNADYTSSVAANTATDMYIRQPCGVCVDTFRQDANKNAQNGAVNAATTLDACKAACLADTACLALDWVKSGTADLCWLHTNADYASSIGTNTATDMYIREPCGDGSSAPPGECYLLLGNRNSEGGTLEEVPQTLEACQAKCTELSCAGIDWVIASTECWVHTVATNLDTFTDNSGVEQYSRSTTCTTPDPCNDVYRLIGARNSEGASQDNAVSTLENCWTACTASTTCVALEFTNTNECWLHSSLTALDTFNANANVNQYVRERCGECVNTFELKANRGSANGIRQSGINTIQACKDRCSGMDTTQVCYGFDWNKNDNECWFHFTQAAIDGDFSDASSNQYAINRCTSCTMQEQASRTAGGITNGISAGTMTAAACSLACENSQDCTASEWRSSNSECHLYLVDVSASVSASSCCTFFFKDCPECVIGSYERFTGNKYNNGVQQATSVNNPSLCAELCNSHPNCPAFDFNVNNRRCFIFTSALTGNMVPDAAVNHYDVNTCPDTTDPPANGAVAFWATTGQQNNAGSVGFTQELVDNGNNFNLDTDRFTSPSSSKYFIAMSAAADSSQPLRLQTTNTSPILNMYTRDSTHNQPVYVSVDAIVSVADGAAVGVTVEEGRTYDSTGISRNDLTSLAMFNIDNAMSDPDYFYADRSTPTNVARVTLAFPDIHTSATQLVNSVYTCDKSGIFYLFLSVGAQQIVRIELTHVHAALGTRDTYELIDRDTTDTNQNILSRSIMLTCEPNDELSVYIHDGTFSGPNLRSSFGGFYYTPRHNNEVAWAAYRYTEVAANPSGPDYSVITFGATSTESTVPVNQPSNSFSQTTSRFTAPRSGIYLVHFSGCVAPGSVTDLGLFLSNQMVASIYDGYTGHDGKVVVSRTVILQVNSGQTLDIRVAKDSALVSDTNSKEIAFMGMLIYEN